MVFHRDLFVAMRVCPHCDHHLRLTATERLEQIFDVGSFGRLDIPEVEVDPLRFRDEKKYTDRLKESRTKTGEIEAAVAASGKMGGLNVVAVVQYFAFMGGSMGLAVGEALIAGAERAIAEKVPLIVFAAAGGARMQEGILGPDAGCRDPAGHRNVQAHPVHPSDPRWTRCRRLLPGGGCS